MKILCSTKIERLLFTNLAFVKHNEQSGLSTRRFPAVLASGEEKSGNSSGNLITEPVKIEPIKFKESVSSQSGHR